MSVSRDHRRIELRRQRTADTDLHTLARLYELVDESGVARHRCGHEVLWQLLPGVDGDTFLRSVRNYDCPCCGGETGHVPPGVEWPTHVGFASIGIAHCHLQGSTCRLVDWSHRHGLHLAERRA